jgi:hypothetical protein
MPAKWHSLTILCASAAALVERTSSSGSSGHGGSEGISIRHRSTGSALTGSSGSAHETLSSCPFFCHEVYSFRGSRTSPLTKESKI